MTDALHAEIISALTNDTQFSFKNDGRYLKYGRCPGCGRKTAFISIENPGRVSCSHTDSCGYTETVKERYPDIFQEIGQRHPPTPEDPNATAKAYMSAIRGFPLLKVGNWFTQGVLPLRNGKHAPTVRFMLWDGYYWERLINQSDIDVWGDKNHNKKGLTYKDKCWCPPGFSIKKGDTVFVVEGIFHAIAITLAGRKAVASFSSNVLPRELIHANKGKGITWALGYDNDENGAGNKAAIKFRHELRKLKEAVDIYQCPVGKDWDDVYREGNLDDSFFDDCLHRGRVNTAESVEEKAYWIFSRNQYKQRVVEFGNRFYSVSTENFQDRLESEIEGAKQTDIEGDDSGELFNKTVEDAIKTVAGRRMFQSAAKIYPISNCLPRFLYAQQDKLSGEIGYSFSINYPSGQPPVFTTLSGSALESPASFNKALLNQAAGATFDGTADQLKRIREGWFDYGFQRVDSVSFVGYDKESGLYIYPEFAFSNGRYLRPNKNGFVDGGKTQLKTTLRSINLKTSKTFDPHWIDNFKTVFAKNGLCTLGFFLGSLYAEQIRSEVSFFPFLELTGEAGAGKTTLLEFCWKLLGRQDYEGFNPSKATFAARARAFSQVSNMPVVLIEGDSRDGTGDAKKRGFDFEELKDAFNGRGIRATGAFNRGNDIEEPPFRGTVLIAQNASVDGSEALLTRIVHLHATRAHQKRENKGLADWFRRVDLMDVSGFLFQALTKEKAVIETILKHYKRIDEAYAANQSLKHARIVECHALVAAMVRALPLVIPNIPADYLDACEDHLLQRALNRQQRMNADHPMVALFWEIYEALNVRSVRSDKESMMDLPGRERETLNHSKNDALIAISLLEFKAEAEKARFGNLDINELKRLLPNSQTRPFVEAKNVKSQLNSKAVFCWVFKKPGTVHLKP